MSRDTQGQDKAQGKSQHKAQEKPSVKGILIPIGGNEDKGDNELEGLEYISDGILATVVRESGGPTAKIVVIPTASSIPEAVGENYLDAFAKLDCTDVTVLDIRETKQAEDATFLKHIQEAACIMFSGGDQSRISEIIGGTSMHKLLQERFVSEPVVIAGTSAGAMAMTNEMVAGGSSTEALQKGAVLLRKGLALIPELIMDTHFIKRGRFGRMAEAVAAFPTLVGIGLAEDTGMVIKNCSEYEVIGSGMVIVFDGRKLEHNLWHSLPESTPMTVANLVTHILARGDCFTIGSHRINIVPLKKESFAE